ncbi:MAG: hypothetical protein DHS20C15_29900 [Planctomycetota bacterium]|nr:MAG: hypothetical protein DHS20C15_29900 [Planctomycetota bacterium]
MSLLLRDLRVPLELEGLPPAELAARKLGVTVDSASILRKSLDARAGREPVFIYTLRLDLTPAAARRLAKRRRPRGVALVDEATSAARELNAPTRTPPERAPLRHRPVIVGAGPAGLFAAWQLLRDGFRPLLLERGQDATTRARQWFDFLGGGAFDPESNLLFGEGGAGTFSDGKLTTRIKDPRVASVLNVFVQHGAPESTRWLAKPHLGSNALPGMVRAMRRALVAAGAEVRFGVRVDELLVERDAVVGLRCGDERIDADAVVLAIGHSARDTYDMLIDKGVAMTAKPFQLGLRVEHPQEFVDRAQYGAACGHPNLPVAEYSLVSRKPAGAGDVYSFCMCPGGEILPATQRAGLLCVNGASPRARDGRFANSGVVITVQPGEFGDTPRGGLALQERLEARAFQLGGNDFGAPGQRVVDFLANRVSTSLGPTSYPFAVRSAPLAEVLPDNAVPALQAALRDFDRKLPGYVCDEAMLVGPESRSSAPLRIERGDDHASISHAGLYPVGEGAGWAGGIVSAAVDGLRAAEALAVSFRPASNAG